MSAVAETSFFCPKNVRFSNPKLGPAVDANRKINWLRPENFAFLSLACFDHRATRKCTVIPHCRINGIYNVTTCQQLLKLHFSAPKMSDFLILNWGRRLTRTEKLTDCGPRTLPSSHLHALIIVQLESALLYHTAELMAFTITFSVEYTHI